MLHHVSALELKHEAMIKLPIKLRCQPNWRRAIQEAVKRQGELEKLAREEEAISGEYLRPIVLFQAQNESETRETITAEGLKKGLMEDCGIPEDQIAIATGKKDEIEGVALLKRECPVRFIVTVQKLREGWDCPFAYVLCSLSGGGDEHGGGADPGAGAEAAGSEPKAARCAEHGVRDHDGSVAGGDGVEAGGAVGDAERVFGV